MARKKKFSYKNLRINEEALSITKIGEMPNTNKSPFFLFFIFGIFILFIFFLPDVVDYLANRGIPFIEGSSSLEKPVTPEITDGKEIIYYPIKKDSSVPIAENIIATDFTLANNTLSFTISNQSNARFYFSKYNYFIELYDANKKLLERIILGREVIPKNESLEASYEILSSTMQEASSIVFVEKQVEDYPYIEMTKNEDGQDILTCTHNYETITYTFQEDTLLTITDVVNRNNVGDTLDFQNDLSLWQSRVAFYNRVIGITSSFVSSSSGFNVNTVVDVEQANLSTVDNEYYYDKYSLPKVISFEMEARGFRCS